MDWAIKIRMEGRCGKLAPSAIHGPRFRQPGFNVARLQFFNNRQCQREPAPIYGCMVFHIMQHIRHRIRSRGRRKRYRVWVIEDGSNGGT